MIKKMLTITLVIALALALALSLGGCGNKDKAGGKSESLDAPSESPDDEEGLLDVDFSGSWPDNEFTKQVPKPGFSLGMSYSDDKEFNISFEDVTMDDVRKYSEKLKGAGFTENIDVYDTDDLVSALRDEPDFAGMTDEEIAAFLEDFDMEDLGLKPLFTFEAGNGAGYFVKLFWYEDTETTFKISKE